MDEYGSAGFKVLAFPCNQFASQEPGTHDEILAFVDQYNCRDKFDWFKKGSVNGRKTREVYSFLKRELPNPDGTSDIRWNFAKFLVDHKGVPYKRYAPKKNPLAIKSDIEELIERMKKESS